MKSLWLFRFPLYLSPSHIFLFSLSIGTKRLDQGLREEEHKREIDWEKILEIWLRQDVALPLQSGSVLLLLLKLLHLHVLTKDLKSRSIPLLLLNPYVDSSESSSRFRFIFRWFCHFESGVLFCLFVCLFGFHFESDFEFVGLI